MPILPGKSKEVQAQNFREFGKGPTYQHTEAKFGKARADKQRIAVVLSNARKSGSKHQTRRLFQSPRGR